MPNDMPQARPHRRWAQLLAGITASVLAIPAFAQEPAPRLPLSSHDSALSEFQQARRFVDAGDCAAALPHLEESIAYEPSVGARLSVAECVEGVDPLRAWRALADAGLLAYLNHDERLIVIQQRLTELERAVPLVHLQLTRSELERRGLEVTIDGQPIDRYHVQRPIAVSAGAHTIEVRALGTIPWQQAVAAPAVGVVLELPVVLVDGRAPPVAPVVSPPPPLVVTIVRADPRAARRVAGLALGATGLAALTAGVVFGAFSLSKRAELDDVCGGARERCQASAAEVAPVRDNASTLAAVSTASFVVAGAAVLGGLTLYLWPGGASPGAKRVGIAPMVGPVSGLRMGGGF